MITPNVSQLREAVEDLAAWQIDNFPVQLHPGDVAWYSRRSLETTAAQVRLWVSGRTVKAFGLLDGADLLRLAVDPRLANDGDVAAQMAADLNSVSQRIFTGDRASVEVRAAAALSSALRKGGWERGESWTSLRATWGGAPERPTALKVSRARPQDALDWAQIHMSAFRPGQATEQDVQRFAYQWQSMAGTTFYAQGQYLLGRTQRGTPVAAAAVWSAGPGRPGLLEPVSVHPDHQGLGFGADIIRAALRQLHSMGASCALVATPTDNAAGVGAYTSAGFIADAPVPDLTTARTSR